MNRLAAKPFYLGVIPARGGSKRIPGKNLAEVAGKPLIGHTIEVARRSVKLGRTIVSTDDPRIAEAARALGANVPFLRPKRLAGDASPTIDSLLHALREVERGGTKVDAVVLLQPTSPFRKDGLIDACIERFEAASADTLTTVSPSRQHPYHAWRPTPAGGIETFHPRRWLDAPKKRLPVSYAENGAVYVCRRGVLLRRRLYGRRVVPFVIDERSALDIDTPEDLDWARYLCGKAA